MHRPRNNHTFASLGKVLRLLYAVVIAPKRNDRSNIDATIHRFKYSFDLSLRLLTQLIREKGVDVVYPTDVLRAAYTGNLIDQEDQWLRMLKDRNRTSQTYDDGLADLIYKNIKTYYPVMQETYDRLLAQYATNDLEIQ